MIASRIFHPLECADMESTRPMNNPFDYEPCELVREAARRVVAYLDMADDDVRGELARGKMLGVLVVRRESGEVGFLAGFSGAFRGRTHLDGFVPPIYDLDCEGGYFRDGEERISQLGREIEQIEQSAEYREAYDNYIDVRRSATDELVRAREQYQLSRQERARRRKSATEQERLAIDRESQHQRGELRRLEARLDALVGEALSPVERLGERIQSLKERRQGASGDLQRRIFESYRVLNGRGESRSVYSIFEKQYDHLPPAGAGECAAPKLLQYALSNGLTPLSIGEFWQGPSPRGEVRHHGHFYGACRGKCLPILSFMLQGVAVDLSASLPQSAKAEILFEDEAIVVYNKPSGMLSVRGRVDLPSIEQIAQECTPSAMVAHRLDQDTSGVLVVAKSLDSYRNLQSQFAQRELQKRYIAVVEGHITPRTGQISLPLIPNPLDRPRQVVDHQRGKISLTHYEVLEYLEGPRTRLALYPHTGRTHQLRIHCAHAEGLNAPILGDRLYGHATSPASGEVRLYLHNEQITLRHPATGEEITFRCDATF